MGRVGPRSSAPGPTPPTASYRVGDIFPVAPDSDLARALDAARPVRVERVAAESSLGRLGYGSSLVAPIQVDGRTWGFLAVASVGSRIFGPEHERRLTEFARLISTAITNIEDRAALATQASTDALTGVANHRAFYERLAADTGACPAPPHPFVGGHDRRGPLQADQRRRRPRGRGRDARPGRAVPERSRSCRGPAGPGRRRRVRLDPARDRRRGGAAGRGAGSRGHGRRPAASCRGATLSVGICDTRHTADPAELVRLADRALYSSKEQGRDQARLYAPASTDELAAT